MIEYTVGPRAQHPDAPRARLPYALFRNGLPIGYYATIEEAVDASPVTPRVSDAPIPKRRGWRERYGSLLREG